jgi:hypothetical protein
VDFGANKAAWAAFSLLLLSSVASAIIEPGDEVGPITEMNIVILHGVEIGLGAFSLIFCYRVVKSTGLLHVFKYFIFGLILAVSTAMVSFVGGHMGLPLHDLFSSHFSEVVRVIGQVAILSCVTYSFYLWQKLLKGSKDGGTTTSD